MSEHLRISAVDLGTNTVKATHATRVNRSDLTDMVHASDTIRLGEGIEANGRIGDDRIELCLAFLHEQERAGRAYGSAVFIGVATEVLRIASNGTELLQRIHAETGWQIEVISGDREAELTYLGLKSMVPGGQDCAIVDIGGGSTELVLVQNDVCTLSQSLHIGSGRLADRFFHENPPGARAVQMAIDAAATMLETSFEENVEIPFVMLAGGSGLFMNMLVGQLYGAPPFDQATLELLGHHLATTAAEDTVNRIGIPLARAKVLPASVAVAIATMTRFGTQSAIGVPSGIRMGLIYEYE